MLNVRCPNPACQTLYQFPDNLRGRKARCKHCGAILQLGAEGPESKGNGSPSPAKPEPAAPKKMLGRFQIRQRLGAGAFGTVYRAFDPQLEREVALKVPQQAVLDSARRKERFVREAKAAAQLRHPHIVPVYDVGTAAEQYYIASAFIEGKPLADAVEERGMNCRRAAQIVQALAEALAYAHELGIVHRDIKPANVMLDLADQPHLMDFGLAARLDSTEKLTQDGAVMGTPAYMAPEQASGQKGAAQPASDQYSLGVVLYELLTGKTPFEGPPAVVLHNVMHTPTPKISSLRKDVPRDLETICMKAMARDPRDRYANCQALAEDLRRWQEGEPILARRLGLGERLVRWCRREPKLAVAGATVGLCLVVISVLLAMLANNLRGELAVASEQLGEEQRAHLEAVAALDTEKEGQLQELLKQAAASIEDQDPNRALDLLHRIPEDKRGWDWQMAALLAERGPDAVKLLPGHQGQTLGLAFTEDSQRLLSAGQAGDVKFWQIWSGQEAKQQPAQGDWRTAAALSADGRRLALSPTAELHWPPTPPPQLLATLHGLLAAPQQAGALLAGTALLASTNIGFPPVPGPRTITLLDTETGKELKQFSLPPAQELILHLNADGSRLATLHRPQRLESLSVAVWDTQTGQQLLALPQSLSEPLAVALRPDGQQLAAARFAAETQKSQVELWDIAEKQITRTIADLPGVVDWLRYSPDGTQLAGSVAGAVTVQQAIPYTVTVPRLVQRQIVETRKVPYQVTKQIEKDGKKVEVAETQYREEQVTKTTTQAVVACETRTKTVAKIRGLGPAEVRIWDVAAGEQIVALPTRASDAAFSAGNQRLATVRAADGCDNESFVQLWEVPKGRLLVQLPAPAAVDLLVFSPDGNHLAAATTAGQHRGVPMGGVAPVAPAYSRNVPTRTTAPESFTSHDLDGPTVSEPELSPVLWQRGKRGVRIVGQPIILWSLLPRSLLLAQHPGDGGPITGLSFRPDGTLLASYSNCCQRGKVWDVEKNQLRFALGGVQNGLWFHPGQPWLTTIAPLTKLQPLGCYAGLPAAPQRWDPETGAAIPLPDKAGQVAAISADGKRVLALAAAEGPQPLPGQPTPPRVRELATGQEICQLRGNVPPGQFELTPDGQRVLCKSFGYGGSNIYVWDASTGNVMLEEPRPVAQFASSPDGRWLAAALAPPVVAAPMVAPAAPPPQPGPQPPGPPAAPPKPVNDVHLAPVSQPVQVASASPVPVVLTAQDAPPPAPVPGPVPIQPGQPVPGGPGMAKPYQIVLWDLQAGKEIRTLTGVPGFAHGLLFSPDGQALIVIENNNNIRVWDVASGQERLTHQQIQTDGTALSPDGTYLALVNSGGHSAPPPMAAANMPPPGVQTQHLDWVLAQAEGPAPLLVPGQPIPAMPVPGGQPLAASGPTITLWNLRTGQKAAQLHGHIGKIHSLEFSRDSRRLVSAGGDENQRGEVKVWDIATGRRLASYSGHTGPVYTAIFSPDGQRLASGGQDRMVRVWAIPAEEK